MSKTRILKSVPYKDTTLSSIVIHALASGKGITWLDKVRVPLRESEDISIQRYNNHRLDTNNIGWNFQNVSRDNKGRFPANLLCSDDILNDGITTKSRASDYNFEESNQDNPTHIAKNIKSGIHYDDSGSYSRYFDLDKWWEKVISDE